MEQYAIPSRSRAEVFERSTLALLRKLGVKNEQIDVWVVPDQVVDYMRFGVRVCVVSDTVGLRGARNSIIRGYPPGTRLVELDDDCTNLFIGWRGQPLTEVVPWVWRKTLDFAWEQCDKLGLGLWGSYPVCNDYFMRPEATTDLRRVSGGLFGLTLRGDDSELLVCDEKEDYERTCRLFLRDGGVLRLNWLTLRVAYMTGTGGMQDYRTVDSDAEGARRVCALFPKLTKYVPVRGARQTTEVDLRRLGGVSSPIPLPPWIRASCDPRPVSRPSLPA